MKRGLIFALAASLALAAVACGAPPASAQEAAPATVNTEGLTPVQVRAINDQINAAKRENGIAPTTPPQSTAAKVNEWVEVGQGIGSGLAAAARETGQVVNEFAATPVGQLTIVIILFKVMGGDLIQLFVGLLYFATFLPIWLHFYKKFFPAQTTVTVYDETTRQRTTTRSRPAIDARELNGDRGFFIAAGWAGLMGLLAIGCLIIFA